MDQGVPYRRRRAKAVAISETFEARRQALMIRLALSLAALLAVAEAVAVARVLWVAHA